MTTGEFLIWIFTWMPFGYCLYLPVYYFSLKVKHFMAFGWCSENPSGIHYVTWSATPTTEMLWRCENCKQCMWDVHNDRDKILKW